MSLILLVLALVCEVIATILGFGIVTGAHYSGWLAFGLVFWIASLMVGPVVTRVRE
jgi:hypothetical protein